MSQTRVFTAKGMYANATDGAQRNMQMLRRRAAPLIPNDPVNPAFKRVNHEEQEAAEAAALRAAAAGDLPPPPPPSPPPPEQPDVSQSEPSDSRSKRKRRGRGKGGAQAAPRPDKAAPAADAQADSATTASDAASAQQRLSRAVQLAGSVPLAELATQLDDAQLPVPPLPAAAEKESAHVQNATAPQQVTPKVGSPLLVCCCLPMSRRTRHLASLLQITPNCDTWPGPPEASTYCSHGVYRLTVGGMIAGVSPSAGSAALESAAAAAARAAVPRCCAAAAAGAAARRSAAAAAAADGQHCCRASSVPRAAPSI